MSWQTNCRACRSAENAPRLDALPRTSAARRMAQLQALTLDQATSNRDPWTLRDYEVLSDPGMTLLEKALRLRRTYATAKTRATRMGYTSKHSWRIDPADMRRWTITAPNADDALWEAS